MFSQIEQNVLSRMQESSEWHAIYDMYSMIDDLVVNFEWESLKLKCCSFFEIESQAATRKSPHKQKFKNYMYI